MNVVKISLIILIVLFVLLIVILVRRKKKETITKTVLFGSNSPKQLLEKSEENIKKQNEMDRKIANLRPDENYITPTIFEVGVLKDRPFQASNNCLPNVLYPINDLDVDYGSKMPDNCKCDQFVQAP